MRQCGPLRVGAQETGIQDHSRQLGGVHGDAGDLLPAQVLPDQERHERAALPRLDENRIDPVLRQAHEAGQALQHAAQIAGLLADHLDAIGRDVAGQRPADAVENLAARRDQEPLVGTVVLGQEREVGAALDLEMVEPRGERPEERQLRTAERQGTARETAGALSFRLLHGPAPWSGSAPSRAGWRPPGKPEKLRRPRAWPAASEVPRRAPATPSPSGGRR